MNGVVDQSVRRNTSSVANRAEDARLPRAFVDIRHGAHELSLSFFDLSAFSNSFSNVFVLSYHCQAIGSFNVVVFVSSLFSLTSQGLALLGRNTEFSLCF